MKVKDFLNKYGALNKEIRNIDYHISLLDMDIKKLKSRIPQLIEKSDQEVLNFILSIYKKCDSLSPYYDSKFDEEIVRMSLQTHVFNIYPNFEDNFPYDNYNFEPNNPSTSLYDDYIDLENDRKTL